MAKKLTSRRLPTRATANASGMMAQQGKCAGSDSARKIIFVTLLIITTILFVFVLTMIYRSQKQGMQQIIDNESRGAREYMQNPFHQKKRVEMFEESTPKLVFLYMNGCSWCEKFAPEWAKMETKYAKVLSLHKFERNDPDAKKYSEHVAGYPTLLLEKKDGSIVKFAGQRTVEGIESFLKENGVNVAEKYTDKRDGKKTTATTMTAISSVMPGLSQSMSKIGSAASRS